MSGHTVKPGYVVIGPNGKVLVDGFVPSEPMSCRELGHFAMLWAQAQLERAIDLDGQFLARLETDDPVRYDELDRYNRCALDFSETLKEVLEGEGWLRKGST